MMIQALYLFDNNGNPLAHERFGARSFPSKINHFITSFAELVNNGSKKDELGFAEFSQLQVLYKANSTKSLFMIADSIDLRDNLLTMLEKVWGECSTLINQGQISDWKTRIFDIVFDQAIKISIFGRPAVGKTTLTSYLLKETIPLVYKPTIGVVIKHVPTGFFGNHTGVLVWDIAGQDTFSTLWPIYLKNSHLVLITTDSGLETVLWSRRILKSVSSAITSIVLLPSQDVMIADIVAFP
ncbi:unnamed protein product [marine sediment metagenome]|uniref:Uncharacterized protein n=1 Tax=marine sediment metagenome TaxID=412755 RepID=X0ZF26_9ZZZZ